LSKASISTMLSFKLVRECVKVRSAAAVAARMNNKLTAALHWIGKTVVALGSHQKRRAVAGTALLLLLLTRPAHPFMQRIKSASECWLLKEHHTNNASLCVETLQA
jgi:hypothetical protein